MKMTAIQLIEKLLKADKNMQVMIHDGFSVNAIEIESVVSDNTQHVIIITPNEVFDEDLNENTTLL